MEYVKRTKYLDLLWNTKDTDYAKILTGVRRSGKTSILNMHIQALLNSGVEQERIIHINFEDASNDKLRDGKIFHNHIKSLLIPNKICYLFVDEVQMMGEWARYINSLRASCDIDIYLTGSNTFLFSGMHLTYMTGRYIEINVYPLSYNEFLEFDKSKTNQDVKYINFTNGSFPLIAIEEKEEMKNLLMTSIKDSVYERDILSRINIRQPQTFYKISSFIHDSVGKSVSIKKILDSINSSGGKTSFETIESYLELLMSAYILYFCPKYDERGKKLLRTNGKYYSVDIGLAKNIIGNRILGRGQELENFVYLELKKAGYTVYTINVNKDYEVDFYAFKYDKKMYIQVSESILDESTYAREVRPFKYIKNNYPKYIVTKDWLLQQSEYCEHINVFDFIKKL